MSIWAGIKHALNSTLGTSGFKPLNTMIDEAKSSILSKIDGQRTLAASDSPIKTLTSGTTTFSYNGTTVGTFTPKVNGSVSVVAKCSNPYTIGDDYEITLEVLSGTTTIATLVMPMVYGVYEYTLRQDLAITKGVTYTVKMKASISTTLNSLSVCANIVDTSLVS